MLQGMQGLSLVHIGRLEQIDHIALSHMYYSFGFIFYWY